MKYKDLYKAIKIIMRDESFYHLNVKERLALLFNAIKQPLEERHLDIVELNQICCNLLEALDLSLSGRHNRAFDLLYSTYFKDKHIQRLNIKKYKTEQKSFYRMRNAFEYTQFSEDEMYHIPFEKNFLVGNERFSMTGLPTLYLASSIYSCWEETGRQNLDYANIALFKNSSEVNFISLVLPNNNTIIQKLDDLLLTIPLIIATRLKVVHPKEKFIPEYIIPQLLMECVLEYRFKEHRIDDLIGIEYKSVHQNEANLIFSEEDDSNLFLNYAIPPFEHKNEGICPKLKQIFRYWDSTSWAQLQYKRPNAFVTIKEQNYSYYQLSRFGLLEKFLNRKHPDMLTYKTKRIGDIAPGTLTL